MGAEQVERRLAAILAADVAGYSRLMERDESGTLARLKTLRAELIDPLISEHKGRIVKTTGDGILIEFPSVVEAVSCAIAWQAAMAERSDSAIAWRIGVNLGDVVVEDGDIFGDGVNVAARLEGLAEPGGICVSAIVHDQVEARLDCAFEDMGEQALKNIARPVRVYRVKDTLTHPVANAPGSPLSRIAGEGAERIGDVHSDKADGRGCDPEPDRRVDGRGNDAAGVVLRRHGLLRVKDAVKLRRQRHEHPRDDPTAGGHADLQRDPAVAADS